MGGGKKGSITPHVNVTPLVDVTLVVLIIFMVVVPLMTKTFWLNLPKESEDEDKEADVDKSKKNEPLVMTVDKDGVVRVNKAVLAPSDIGRRLPRMLAAKEQKVLYFDAHDELPYGKAVDVLDRARAGGARSIAMLTQKVAH